MPPGIAVTGLLLGVVSFGMVACGDDAESDRPGSAGTSKPELLPGGGKVPSQRITDLTRAAKVADCSLRPSAAQSRDHTADVEEPVRYATNPPTSGRHFQVAAEDGAYTEAPADTAVVHAFEHGRVAIWFRPSLPEEKRAALRAVFDDDPYQLLLVPRAGMPYAAAASAWNRDPEPLGTGQSLVCPRLDDATFDALRAFRDEHRGRGPEPIP